MKSIQPPVLFHPLKHHLSWIRSFIAERAQQGAAMMPDVAAQLLTVGNSQMDVYTGALAPAGIAEAVVQHLDRHNLLDPALYNLWLWQSAGYRLVLLPDGSQWVLRWGEVEGAYVHIHPARYSPDSIRVKASTLKTGILVSIWGQLHCGTTIGLDEINQLRKAWLLLPPIRSMEEAEGLRRVLERLR
jgi:hypothetical protein